MGTFFEKWVGSEGLTHFLRPLTPLVAGVSCLALAGVLALTQVVGADGPGTALPSATPGTVAVTATPSPTTSPTPTPTVTASKSVKASPKPSASTTTHARMWMSVPAIDVSGKLRRTSAVNGVVNPPSGTLAWISGYNRVRPGEVGTAVVAGHVVSGQSPDVFYHLQNIGRGDRITVWDSDGEPVVYTVTATRVANKTEVSRDRTVWGANRSVRRLALITCDDDEGFRADGHRVANFVAIAEAR